MWEDGTPWPPVPGTRLSRAPRPSFTASFGPELETSMARARQLLITGITRNGLVTSYYSRLEDLLSSGCQIRFVLTDPDSDAIGVAASRYYAERSRDSAAARTRHTLRLLTELRSSVGDAISVRLSSHPLATGIIAIDTTTTTPASALFAECYSYQAPGDPPKFAIMLANRTSTMDQSVVPAGLRLQLLCVASLSSPSGQSLPTSRAVSSATALGGHGSDASTWAMSAVPGGIGDQPAGATAGWGFAPDSAIRPQRHENVHILIRTEGRRTAAHQVRAHLIWRYREYMWRLMSSFLEWHLDEISSTARSPQQPV